MAKEQRRKGWRTVSGQQSRELASLLDYIRKEKYMLKYDTILWDLDGTLLNFKMAERHGLRNALENYGITMTEEMLSLYSGINEMFWEKLERGEVDKTEMLAERFRVFFRQMGLDGIDPEEMLKHYEWEMGSRVYYEGDSPAVVSKLREMGIKQYVVTNGTMATQPRKMESSGFDRYMDKVFISDEIGYDKPGKEFFDVVFRELVDVKKEKTLLIGDSLTSDILGANRAGIDACWYNPKGKALPKGMAVHVEYEIKDLQEVFGILSTMT